MMKAILFSILFLCVQNIEAQQWLEFSQQNNYKLFLNPASAGSNSQLYATIAHRSQYTFLSKRNIASQFGEFSMPVLKKEYGLGLKIVNDFIGFQRYTAVEINGAYHLHLNKSRLSFGLGFGLVNLSVNGTKFRASGGDYENGLIIHNDEKIPNENIGGLAPVFSFGLEYNYVNLTIGAAIQNINSPKIKLLKTSNETNIFIDRTINMNASYVIKLNKVNIKPLINYNTDFIKHQLVLGINTELNNIYFGLAFRGYSGFNNDAVIGEFGVKILNKIRIGYSYDYNVSYLNKSNYGSHEISISYFLPQKFSTKSKGNHLFNPRYL